MDDTTLSAILRYVAGESSPAEAEEVRAWIARDPAIKGEVEAWQQLRAARPLAWDTELALAKLQGDLGFGERQRAVRVVKFPDPVWPGRRRTAALLARIAAVMLVGFGLLGLWWTISIPHAASGFGTPAALQEYRAPRGQRIDVRLPDGTRAVLAPETRLRVAANFGRRGIRREVQLEGQAYFEVTHDRTRPFIVRTGTSVTEDLGTIFTVRAYPGEPSVEVAVVQGRVAIRPAHAESGASTEQVLVPGQLARLNAAGGVATERVRDWQRLLAWTTGNLAFHEVPFHRAIADLERWYDIDVRLADSALGARRISGVIVGDSVDAVMQSLALSIGATYVRFGRTVVFSSRRPAP